MSKKRRGSDLRPVGLVAALIIVLVFAIFLLTYSSSFARHIVPSTCVAEQGYLCSYASYNSNGNMTVSVEQDSGSNWSTVTLMFVPKGAAYSNGVPLISWSDGKAVRGGLMNGMSATISLPVSGAVRPGSTVSGTIWAQYQLNAGGSYYYAEVAAINAVAV